MIAHGWGAAWKEEAGGGGRATTLVVHSRATHEEWCSSRQRRAIGMFVSCLICLYGIVDYKLSRDLCLVSVQMQYFQNKDYSNNQNEMSSVKFSETITNFQCA